MQRKRINWRKQIAVLEKYVASKGWHVKYLDTVKNDWADWSKKTISLKSRVNKEVLFYVFLHELGHMLLFQNNRSYSSKYKEVFDEFTGGAKPISLARIEEELDAWRTGFRLAQRLKLKVDRRNFEKTKAKYAMTYITWACQKFVDGNSNLENAINSILEKTSLNENVLAENKEHESHETDKRIETKEKEGESTGCGSS
jgi:hypothetical protein